MEAPHWRQNTTVANPRRFSSTTVCSRFASRSSIALEQRRAEHDVRPVRGVLLPHVDDVDVGERTVVDPLRQPDEVVAAVARVRRRLERRRRRPEHDQRVFHPAADHGDVAAVIPRQVVLLVRPVVLFVDDDESDVLERREDRRPGAHHDRDVAAANAVPLIVTLAVGQAAVLNGDLCSEARTKEARERGRQRDLGREDQNAPAGRHDERREPEVQLGLAASGHAVEQNGPKPSRGRRLLQTPERRGLRGRQRQGPAASAVDRPPPSGAVVLSAKRIAKHDVVSQPEEAEFFERSDRRGADALLEKLGERQSGWLAPQQCERFELLAALR